MLLLLAFKYIRRLKQYLCVFASQQPKSFTKKAAKRSKMNGKSSNNHTHRIANKKSTPVTSPHKSSPPIPSSNVVVRAPIRHRRLSVFNPKKFSAAVAAAVRKTKKNQKLAAAVAGTVAATPSLPSVVKKKATKKIKSTAGRIVLPAKFTTTPGESVEPPPPRPVVVVKASANQTTSPNVASPVPAVSTGSVTKSIKCDVCNVNGTAQDIVR